MSHPTWVRGLKHQQSIEIVNAFWSHPTWVRGLKLLIRRLKPIQSVAPYVGAWIETYPTYVR